MFLNAASSVSVSNFLNALLTLMLISIVSYKSCGACNHMDRDSLTWLNQSFFSTKSPLNWSLSVDCCSWEGVGCDRKSGRVTNLSLPSRGLVGTIHPSIGNLSSVEILSLSHNELTGSIPTDIGRLSELKKLQLHTNYLNGTIPTSLANCTKLTTLNLRFNDFEGNLSAFDFSKFVRLKSIDLWHNDFKGPLPTSLFSCKKLVAIRLGGNNLTGEIVPEIATLNSLSFLSLSHNNLKNFSIALRILSKCKNLTTLFLSLNFDDETISGGDLIGFQNLQVLSFSGSGLTGEIPMWISHLHKLKYLDMSYNRITGSIPHWLGDLSNLVSLDVSSNLLSGTFPIQLTMLSNLQSSNQTTSDQDYFELPMFYSAFDRFNIEQQYNKISNLPRCLNLGSNNISGIIPKEIGRLKFITCLNFTHNSFWGEIPETISNLYNLEKLDLSGNFLTGEIPASLENLNFLSEFSVAYNDLQGPIPEGRQFNTFPSSSYEGNTKLCGKILQRSCNIYGSTEEQKEERHEGDINWVSFVIGFVVSFILCEIAAFRIFKHEGKLRFC